MKLKQLVSIRDSLQVILKEYGSQLSTDTKVDFDDTIDFVSNIILDAERERSRSVVVRDNIIYALKVELR